MPSLSSASPCTHDLGPGITICLRCRQEQRQAARSKQQRIALAGTGAALGLSLLGMTIASALRGSAPASAPRDAANVALVSVVQQGAPQSADPAAPTTAPAPTTARTTTPMVIAAPASLPILVGEGRSDLLDSVVVERAGDSVVVDFDTQDRRTRRRDKFERVVRETLPRVYGASAAQALAAIPDGALLTGDLLTELPDRGLHLPLGTGWTLDLWPETRPGRDGPLVVSYRVQARRS